MTTNNPELWAIEYSDEQRQFHIQREATIQSVGQGWRRIGHVRGTVHDANRFCDEWRGHDEGLASEWRQIRGGRYEVNKQSIPRKRSRKTGFCHPDDRSIPIGKRKVEFVKWLMRKGHDNLAARTICHRRFYKEEHQ